MNTVRAAVRDFVALVTAKRPAREPWSYFGSFGDDFFGDDDEACVAAEC